MTSFFGQSFLLTSFLIFNFSSAKVLQPCELAGSLRTADGVKRETVAQWVCLAKFSSGFNTAAVNGPLSDGSYSYGIFQINDKYCRAGSKWNCGVSCADLLGDEIRPSIKCALKVFQKENFSAWPAWKNDCKGKDVSQYIKRCSLKLSGGMLFNPGAYF